MKKIVTLFACIGIILFFIVFVSCTVGNNEQNDTDQTSKEIVDEETVKEEIPEPQQGGTLTLAVNDPSTLNPLINKDQSIDYLLKLVYDSLVVLDKDQKPELKLAKSIDLGIDNTYITIKLRDDVKWHDGTPLTSKDVVFTLKALKELGQESLYKKSIENVSYFKAIDESTVEIVLKQPYGGYMNTLTFPILPAHVYQGQAIKTSDKNMEPIGTGPYKFTGYTPMKSITLEKNQNWFGGLAYIDEIEATITRDDSAKVTSFEADLINAVHIEDIDWGKFSSNTNWKINEFTTYYYDFIGMNFNHPQLSNVDVRRAMVHAINRKDIVEKYLMGHGVITETPIHPDSWLNKDEVILYDYDTAKAKSILEEAGLLNDSNDTNTTEGITLDLLVSNSDPVRVAICQEIKNNLSTLGITVNVVELSPDEFLGRVKEGNYDMFYGGWHLSPVLDLTFAFGSSGAGNYINYSNPTMDNLLSATFNATDEAGTKEAYGNLIDFIGEEVPYISLFFRTNAVITNQDVYGTVLPSEHNIYETIDQWFIYKKDEVN